MIERQIRFVNTHCHILELHTRTQPYAPAAIRTLRHTRARNRSHIVSTSLDRRHASTRNRSLIISTTPDLRNIRVRNRSHIVSTSPVRRHARTGIRRSLF